MRKVIAAINMTLDGFCDHTSVSPGDEVHHHYKDLLDSAGVILYGRKTFQLMEFWKSLIENPSGEKAMDEFAVAMNRVPKIVFTKTLKDANWETASIASRDLNSEISRLREETGKDIFIGSRSLIIEAMKMGLVDEFQLMVHPVIAGSGLPLFDQITERIVWKLKKTKTFGCGAVALFYERPKK